MDNVYEYLRNNDNSALTFDNDQLTISTDTNYVTE